MNILKTLSCLLLFSSYGLFSCDENQPTTIYCHGLGGNTGELSYYMGSGWIYRPAKTFQFDDDCSSLGQGEEIKLVRKNINEEESAMVVANSRGGSAALSCIGQYNPANLRALVVKSAPADMLNIVDEIQYKIGLFTLMTRSAKEWALRQIYPNYPKNSMPPVAAIANIKNKKLPVLIVHSAADTVVGIRSGYQNYNAFKKAGFENVYFCELQESDHNNISKTDEEKMSQVLHSFYKKHDFQHDPKKATIINFQPLQPTVEEIDKKLHANLWELRKQSMINATVVASVVAIGLTIKYTSKK